MEAVISLLERMCVNMKSSAGFINVILREIQDNLPSLLDSALRMLLQLLAHWKTAVSAGPGDKVGHALNDEMLLKCMVIL